MTYASNSNINIPGLLQTEDNVLIHIFKYLSYHDLATMRIVCQRFKVVIRPLLNEGFNTARLIHGRCLKDIKKVLPRRESQRLLHPLGGHYFLLACIDPKIELLHLTFLKYKSEKSRIFIPGKVLDELFKCLRLVQEAIKIDKDGGTLNDSEQKLNNLRIELSELMTSATYSCEDSLMTKTSEGISSLSMPAQYSTLGTASASRIGRFIKKEKKCVNSIKFASLQIELNKSCRRLKDRELAVLELNKVLNEQTAKLSDHKNLLEKISNSIAENDRKMLSLMNKMNISAGVSPTLLHQSPDDVESQKSAGISTYSSVTKNLDTTATLATGSSNVNESCDKKRKMGCDGLICSPGRKKIYKDS